MRLTPILAGILLAFASSATHASAEDWKTTDGTVYHDVKVIRVEDDAVTIMYRDGGALIFLVKLPPAIQKQFSYDPVKAKIAAEARAKEDAENSKALQVEIEKAEALKRQQQIEDAKAQYRGTNAPPH